MAQQPPPDQPPSWLATPTDYQAPAAPTPYQDWTPQSEQAPPESFAPVQTGYIPPTAAQAQAVEADSGWSFSIGTTKVTGWHAALLIGASFAAWTALNGYWYMSTNADFVAYENAPACATVADYSCRMDFAARVTGDLPSTSTCRVYAYKGQATDGWYGDFPADACSGLSGFVRTFAEVGVWKGQVVYVWRGAHQYWSTDSTVGDHMSAASSMLLPLFLDGVFILAVVLSLIARLTRGRRLQS